MGSNGDLFLSLWHLLYEGAAERIERTEAVSKSSPPIESRTKPGPSSATEVAIVASAVIPYRAV